MENWEARLNEIMPATSNLKQALKDLFRETLASEKQKLIEKVEYYQTAGLSKNDILKALQGENNQEMR